MQDSFYLASFKSEVCQQNENISNNILTIQPLYLSFCLKEQAAAIWSFGVATRPSAA